MKHLLCSLLALLVITSAHATSADEVLPEVWETAFQPLREQLLLDGPVTVDLVRAPSPSPVMTAYEPTTRRCLLFINVDGVLASDPLERLVALAHEAGHCVALRDGRQSITEGPTLLGEGYADAYALAWVAVHAPAQLEEAAGRLLVIRNISRRINPIYNTLIIVRLSLARLLELRRLGEAIDPRRFAAELTQP